jgi:hypothetical protein
MKVGISRFVVAAAIAALVVVGGSSAASAQCSPTAVPNFTPDFSMNQNCLTLNGIGPQFFSTGEGGPVVLRLTPNSGNQVASAWFNNAQAVQNGFSTSFQFVFSNGSGSPADGIAFVIQNAPTPLNAIGFTGGNGGALGYGDDDANANPSTGEGIHNSLAIEFDTYENSWDPGPSNGSVSHVAIQSCGTGANTSHHNFQCAGTSGPNSTIAQPFVVPNLSDGNPHNVTITYNPAKGTSPANIHVILDTVDIFGAVPVDLSSIGLGAGNTAYVGFTAATGGQDQDQDIANWTYMPGSQSGVISTATPTVFAFQGGTQNNAYDYNAQLTAGGVTSATGTINPILIDQKSCNNLVQKSFPLTQCFVYQNAGIVNGKSVDSAVLFELTCPDQPDGTCGDPNAQDFFAELGSDFTFSKAENPFFQLLNSTIGPYPGWLKGTGPNPLHPCSPFTNNSPALFQSNQIDSFNVTGDPLGTTKGKSGGSGSCWAATFATFGELPPGVKISFSPVQAVYTKNQPVTASYTCSTPITSKPSSSAVGPYLTVNSCTQSSGTQTSCTSSSSGMACTGTVNTSRSGILQLFTVTSKDTGGNVGANFVIYNVK